MFSAPEILRSLRSLGMTALLPALAIPGFVSAQVSGQSFEVTPEVHQATVGDSVTLRFRVRLDERDLLFDTVPRPVGTLPPGVRLIAVDKMSRSPDRIFHGSARLVFYRTGRRPVPVFGLPFMRAVKGVQRGTLASDSAFVEILSLLPAGNPPLKDIKEAEIGSRPDIRLLAAAGVAALVLLGAFSRFRRRRPAPVAPTRATLPPQQAPPTPYALALLVLDRIEQATWPAQGQVARHYESIVDVLRNYLESAERVPARERTTEELLWALPPHLSDHGAREALRDVLDEADLVKFALFRPSPAAAALFLDRSRNLLRQWHGATPSVPMADAIR